MPKFAIISPTHIPGKKQEAWGNFRDGGYIAMGSVVAKDLTGKSFEEITDIVLSAEYGERTERIRKLKDYEQFFSLDIGDYIAVNNTNDGLFGIGVITSGYKFKEHAHNTGSTDPKDFYCHFKDVDWKVATYMRRKDILKSDEKGWAPYGIIHVYPEVPEYITRIIGGKVSSVEGISGIRQETKIPSLDMYERPEWLKGLINDIEKLKADAEHKERAHESLVEAFYELLGFSKYEDIKHRQGRIDICIEHDNKKIIVNEVKKDWHLSWRDRKALSQAYNYAHETGTRYVVLTNGDYYAVFDREKGHSYESQFIGDCRLSKLKNEHLGLIEILKKEKLA